jgi:hypothetical protein
MKAGFAPIRSLVAPDTTFRSGGIYHVPRLVILALLLFAGLLAATVATSVTASDLAQELLLQRELDRIDRIMLNAPMEQREEVKEQVRQQIAMTSGLPAIIGSAVGAVVQWLILFYELWLVSLLLVQFAGGEEHPLAGRRHLRSQYLILMSLIPLVGGELVEAAIVASLDPAQLAGAAAYSDYQEATRVSLSVVEAAGISLADRAPTVRFFLSHLTNPFVWWAGYVYVAGAEEVFGLRARRSVLLAIILLGLLAAQHGALQAVMQLINQ